MDAGDARPIPKLSLREIRARRGPRLRRWFRLIWLMAAMSSACAAALTVSYVMIFANQRLWFAAVLAPVELALAVIAGFTTLKVRRLIVGNEAAIDAGRLEALLTVRSFMGIAPLTVSGRVTPFPSMPLGSFFILMAWITLPIMTAIAWLHLTLLAGASNHGMFHPFEWGQPLIGLYCVFLMYERLHSIATSRAVQSDAETTGAPVTEFPEAESSPARG